MHKKHKNHTFRNVFLSILALLILGTAAFGMSHYRSVKATVNSSFAPSGVDKSRNVSSILKKKTPISILLMGTENGDNGRDYTGRTDSMMVVTIDPKNKTTSITSIPKDIAVVVPGYKGKSPAKIDAAYSYGQAKTVVKTVSKLLNVPIDFYALINMDGMEDVIDQVGGVNVYQQGEKTRMDGAKAINYINSANNDYGRQLRQFDVLSAILHKSDSISTLLNQGFFNTMAEQTQTDLTFADLNILARNYFDNDFETNQTHMQGTSAKVAGQSMKIVKDSELQRITNFVRNNLDLNHAKTGEIAYQKGEKITVTAKKKTKKKATKKTKKVTVKKETTDSNTSSDTDNGTANSAASDTTGTTSSATGSSSTAGSGSTANSSGNTSSYGDNSSSGTSGAGSSYGSGSTGNSGSSVNSNYYGGGSSSNTGSSSTTGNSSGSGSSSSNSGESSYGSGSSASTDSSSSGVNDGYASSGYGE